MKTAIIKTTFWDDEAFESLNLDSKLLYFYLLANPTRTLHKIIKLNDKIASAYTGLSIDQISICKNQLEEKGLVSFKSRYYVLLKDYVEAKKGRFTTRVIAKEDSEIPSDVKQYFSSLNLSNPISNKGNYTGTIPEHNNNNKDNNKDNNRDKDKDKDKKTSRNSKKVINYSDEYKQGSDSYNELKAWCDEYALNVHRKVMNDFELVNELGKMTEWVELNKVKHTNPLRFAKNWLEKTISKRIVSIPANSFSSTSRSRDIPDKDYYKSAEQLEDEAIEAELETAEILGNFTAKNDRRRGMAAISDLMQNRF